MRYRFLLAILFVFLLVLAEQCQATTPNWQTSKVIDGDTVEFSSVVGARCNVPLHRVIFPDGRALLFGTQDTSLARTLYSQYVGL